MSFPFLTASWEELIVINYKIDPALLNPYLPRGSELDLYEGQAFVSLIAFNFRKCRLFGFIPCWPQNFEEINLRFYVKRKIGNETRRAVVFIKEIVPSTLVALIARAFYNEPYESMRCGQKNEDLKDGTFTKSYFWENSSTRYFVETNISDNSKDLLPGSFEEFILEHYWGYTAMPDASTSEYQVTHKRWEFNPTCNINIAPAIASLYGETFAETLSANPYSAFFVPGSPVQIGFGNRFKIPLPSERPFGWVLYDGRCGFCSKWVPFWKKQLSSKGFEIEKLQADWLKSKIKMHGDEFTADIRLLLNDNTLINGADVYIYILKQFKITWLIGFIWGLPLIRQLIWKAYRKVNLNRFFISKVCGLDQHKD